MNPNYEGNNVIFINESLTIKNAILFRKVRQSVKQIISSFFGHLMAKLCVGKQMNTTTIIIKNEEDIN